MKITIEKGITGFASRPAAGHKHSLRAGHWGEAFRQARPINRRTGYPEQLATLMIQAAERCPTIVVDSNVMEGQPCIRETRVPVKALLRAIEHSGSIDGALSLYPHITTEQVKDALHFSQLVLELPSGIDEASFVD